MANEFYIEPNSTITIYKNMPLDERYDNTIYFQNETAQTSYFDTQALTKGKTFNQNSYQRLNKNTLRLDVYSVGLTYENLYNYDYMRFINTSYENKWFYAFILDVKFINNRTVEIQYQIDVMQSWMFDYSLLSSFVEREHATHDVAGDNLIDEGLETGDYMLKTLSTKGIIPSGVEGEDGNWSIVVFSTIKTTSPSSLYTWRTESIQSSIYIVKYYWRATIRYSTDNGTTWTTYYENFKTPVDVSRYIEVRYWQTLHPTWTNIDYRGSVRTPVTTPTTVYVSESTGQYNVEKGVNNSKILNGVYCGLNVTGFNSKWEVQKWLNDTTEANLSDGVVAIMMIPDFCYAAIADTFQTTIPANYNITDITRPTQFEDAQGNTYIPINQKMFTSPYMQITVSGHNGNSADFPYEFFATPTEPSFYVTGITSCNPQMGISPINYKGISGDNKNELLTAGEFPQCAYSIDSYRAWVAQGGEAKLTIDTGSAIAKGVTSIVSAGLLNSIKPVTATAGTENVVGGLGAVGTIIDTASQVGKNLVELKNWKTKPPQAKGSNAGSLAIANNMCGFQIYSTQILPQFARIIDSYFSLYGYKTNLVKKPNRMARKRWTYTKTTLANIVPTANGMPNSAVEQLKAIYNKGITFWRYAPLEFTLDVGNYFTSQGAWLDNSILANPE